MITMDRMLSHLPNIVRRKIDGRPELQRIIRNTAWLFADKMIRMTVGIFVTAWTARYLGPDQFGVLSYASAFVIIITSFASLGLDGIVVRNIVQTPLRMQEILGTAFVLKLIGGAVSLFAAILSISILRGGDATMQWIVGIIAFGTIFQAFDAIDFWFQSQLQSRSTVIAKNVAFLALSAVKVVLIIVGAPLLSFAAAAALEIAAGSAGLIIAYRAHGRTLAEWKTTGHQARELLRDSWPLIFSGIVSIIYLRIDQIMLGEMKGDNAVGIYATAVMLAEVWYFVPMVIVPSVFPGLVELKMTNASLFYDRLQKLYNLMAFLGYVVAVVVTVASGAVVRFIYGPAYAEAAPMLAILVWAGVFVNLGVARSAFLMSMNWTRAHFFTVFLGCIVNVLLNYALIPPLGGVGAVIASCVAYWFAAHGACFFYGPLRQTGIMLTKALVAPKIW